MPPGARIYAIGDIHGRLDLLQQLRAQIRRDAAAAGAGRQVLVYLGDYVDRGMQSREVIDLLLEQPLEGFEEVHLLGNHEDTMQRFLDEIAVGSNWLHYGGNMTLRSYGIQVPTGEVDQVQMERLQQELRTQLPVRHLAFLKSLRLSYEIGDYFFVHAGVRPGVPFAAQHPEDLIWIRDEFLTSRQEHGKRVVHGHSISEEVQVEANRIGIDTGAYFSGQLTCLVLQDDGHSFLQT